MLIHNSNIRNPAQNSASGNYITRHSITDFLQALANTFRVKPFGTPSTFNGDIMNALPPDLSPLVSNSFRQTVLKLIPSSLSLFPSFQPSTASSSRRTRRPPSPTTGKFLAPSCPFLGGVLVLRVTVTRRVLARTQNTFRARLKDGSQVW